MQVQLVMFKSDGSRRDFTLTRGRIIIGRTNEVGLRIPLSSVSRKHCEIAIEDGVLKLRDLGSSNGTIHNSVRVKEVALSPGDQIEVGPVVFIVVINGEPAEVEPVRSLVEQDLVDTSVDLPAQGNEDESDNATIPAEPEPVPVAQLIEPAPVSKSKPSVHEIAAQMAEAEALMKASSKAAATKPPGSSTAFAAAAPAPIEPQPHVEPLAPADSFSEGMTAVDLDDPIAALERLAAEQNNDLSTLAREANRSGKKNKT